jgi:hypothetical protein
MAILHDRVQIAKNVNATVSTLDDAPRGYQDSRRTKEVHSRPPRCTRRNIAVHTALAKILHGVRLPGAASGAGPTFSAPRTVGTPGRRVRPLQAPRRSR